MAEQPGASDLLNSGGEPPQMTRADAFARRNELVHDEAFKERLGKNDPGAIEDLRKVIHTIRAVDFANVGSEEQILASEMLDREQRIERWRSHADIPEAVAQQIREDRPVTRTEYRMAEHEKKRMLSDADFRKDYFSGNRAAPAHGAGLDRPGLAGCGMTGAVEKPDDLPPWGEKMIALPIGRQRAFVEALFDEAAPIKGDGLLVFTARKAGYGAADGSSTNKSLSVIANRLAHDKRVQSALGWSRADEQSDTSAQFDRKKRIFGHDAKRHPVLGFVIEQGSGALSVAHQARNHLIEIEQTEGKAAADAMRAKLNEREHKDGH